METPIYEPSSGNPFAERPSTARQREQQNRSTEIALAELDKESNAPDGKDGLLILDRKSHSFCKALMRHVILQE